MTSYGRFTIRVVLILIHLKISNSRHRTKTLEKEREKVGRGFKEIGIINFNQHEKMPMIQTTLTFSSLSNEPNKTIESSNHETTFLLQTCIIDNTEIYKQQRHLTTHRPKMVEHGTQKSTPMK